MEIDHFNPCLEDPYRNRYENLFLATRHCNGSKSNNWPSRKARKKGIRFLNPCAEMDYGPHIVEHPITHRLIGLTAAGDFHITTCDLNADHLVYERTQRAKIFELLESKTMLLKAGISILPGGEQASSIAQMLREQVEKMIPKIPYLSAEHPKYSEELDLVAELGWTSPI